jgi:hypothetical protein
MPPLAGPAAGVQLLPFIGSYAGQVMQFQALNAPSTRHAHVSPG